MSIGSHDRIPPPMTPIEWVLAIIILAAFVGMLVALAAGVHNEAMADAEAEANRRVLEQIQQLNQSP